MYFTTTSPVAVIYWNAPIVIATDIASCCLAFLQELEFSILVALLASSIINTGAGLKW